MTSSRFLRALRGASRYIQNLPHISHHAPLALCLAVCLVLCLALCPVPAFAEDALGGLEDGSEAASEAGFSLPASADIATDVSADISVEIPDSPEAIYEALVGEIALSRDDLPLAALAYRKLALRSQNADIIERAIQISRAAGDFEEALDMLPLWQSYGNPDPSRFAVVEAALFLGTGRILEMERPILTLLETDPALLENNFLGLVRILEQGDDKAALYALISRLAARYPDVAVAQFALAIAANMAGEQAAAHTAILRARALNPDSPLPLLARSDWFARDFANKQKVDPEAVREHLRHLEEFLVKHPEKTSNVVRTQLARLLILSGNDMSRARQIFEHLLADQPGNPAFLYSAAMLALQADDLDFARQLLERALSMRDGADMAHFLLGQVEERAGNKTLAQEHYEEVSYGSPYYFSSRARLTRMFARDDLALARRMLAASEARTPEERVLFVQAETQLLRENGQDKESLVVLAAALKKMPDHPELLYEAAMTSDKLRNWAEMEKYLQRLIRLQPGNADAYNALGYSLADRNLRLGEARVLIDKALKLSPKSPHILDSFGWVLYRQGKLNAALSALEEAYARMNDPEIAAHLGEVLWRLGRHDEAETLWRQEIEKSPEHSVLKATRQRFLP